MNEITFHYRHWQTSMNFDTVHKWSIRMVDNARRFFSSIGLRYSPLLLH